MEQQVDKKSSPELVQPMPPKKSKKLLFITLIVVFVLVLAIGGGLAFRYFKYKSPKQETPKQADPDLQNIRVEVKSEEVDLKESTLPAVQQ